MKINWLKLSSSHSILDRRTIPKVAVTHDVSRYLFSYFAISTGWFFSIGITVDSCFRKSLVDWAWLVSFFKIILLQEYLFHFLHKSFNRHSYLLVEVWSLEWSLIFFNAWEFPLAEYAKDCFLYWQISILEHPAL